MEAVENPEYVSNIEDPLLSGFSSVCGRGVTTLGVAIAGLTFRARIGVIVACNERFLFVLSVNKGGCDCCIRVPEEVYCCVRLPSWCLQGLGA